MECAAGQVLKSEYGLPPFFFNPFHDDGRVYEISCPGGGRIDHNLEEKKIVVYGYSQGFGLADHSISKAILAKIYPEHDITWNNEGY